MQMHRFPKNEKLRRYGRRGVKAACLLCMVCALTSCGPKTPVQQPQQTGFLPALPGNYDSMDTAVLVAKDTDNGKLTFLNLELGKYYTLNYDGATTYADRYDQALSLAQVTEGSVVDVTFMREQKRLNSLQVSPESFSYDQVSNLVMDDGGRHIDLQNESYTISKDAVVFTQDGRGELMDINPADTLTIAGTGHTVYSVRIEKGHGYLRLENASYFEGGWIQIGERIVYQVTKDMLLAVPEGSYTVTVSNKGSTGSEKVTIARNQEIRLDASGWITEPVYGKVVFTVSPDTAKVYIDGDLIDASRPQELSYGIHQMVAAAEGYETVSRYIRVAEEKANLNITLEYKGTESENSVSENETPTILSDEPAVIGPTILSDEGAYTISGNGIPTTAKDPSVPTPVVTVPTEPTPQMGQTIPTVPTVPTVPTTPAATPTPSVNPNVAQPATVSSNDVVSTDGYRVYVDAPAGVEVYKDGAYIGISPVSFVKKQGIYTITLRRDGYQTRSYTVEIDDEKNNVNYSFSELVEIR
ncbi:MAG: PEGA domain-containing protein [Lachnospiraceae bacterium]|nr:PEGA domain-containing protein [Lachnospiraceae bacterium]